MTEDVYYLSIWSAAVLPAFSMAGGGVCISTQKDNRSAAVAREREL